MADEPHDRITHVDLLNMFNSTDRWQHERISKSEMREMRNEMRWMIGVGFALMLLLFIGFREFRSIMDRFQHREY